MSDIFSSPVLTNAVLAPLQSCSKNPARWGSLDLSDNSATHLCPSDDPRSFLRAAAQATRKIGIIGVKNAPCRFVQDDVHE